MTTARFEYGGLPERLRILFSPQHFSCCPSTRSTARELTDAVARLLETEIADRPADALAFESARGGGYLTLGQARYTFAKAAAVDGCGGVRLHDLHTCASLVISAGANVKMVQRLLGRKTAC
jgi:integrase